MSDGSETMLGRISIAVGTQRVVVRVIYEGSVKTAPAALGELLSS